MLFMLMLVDLIFLSVFSIPKTLPTPPRPLLPIPPRQTQAQVQVLMSAVAVPDTCGSLTRLRDQRLY